MPKAAPKKPAKPAKAAKVKKALADVRRKTVRRLASVKAATAVSAIKRERLEARIDASQKALIEHAAQLQGRSVTDFVLTTVQEAAARVIRDAAVIALSAEASQRFAQSLLASPVPNATMQRAANLHRRLLGA